MLEITSAVALTVLHLVNAILHLANNFELPTIG
jgi:hypothetical protein